MQKTNLITMHWYFILIIVFNRNTLNEIYFGKTRDIVNGLRSVQPLAEKSQQEALQKDLFKAINAKGGAKEWCHGNGDSKLIKTS